jgi:tRNA A37 threonylcarbamoyladenosine dehydratase
MNDIFSRTEALLGAEAVNKLKNSRVAIFGLGGVGSAAFEALLRSGIGTIDVFDYDRFSETNLNRQLLATKQTVGMFKTEAAVRRGESISEHTRVIPHEMFFLPDRAHEIDFSEFDFVIDAVDTVTAKLLIIEKAFDAGVPMISCMGTGNKTDPTKLRVADLFDTVGCPLARVVRKEVRKRNILRLKVVCSDEKPTFSHETGENKGNRPAPASAVFVPATAGMILAHEAVKTLIKPKTDVLV